MKSSIGGAVLGVLLVAAPAMALAQSPPSPESRFEATTLDVSAYGEVSVPPDMATIELGVTSQGRTAAQAMTDNAAAMDKVVAALRAGGIEARDIQTARLSLSPQYAYAQGQPPRLTGYEASNQVTVTVRNLDRLGAAADAAVGSGATNVGAITFSLAAPASAENTARFAAVKALEDKATVLADAAGHHIRRLVNLTEGAPETAPPRPMFAARVAAAPVQTPVEAGEIKVRIDVSGEFELAP